MIKITESNRKYPASFMCECGQKVPLVLHHDYLENSCICGRHYSIDVGPENIFNCCCDAENSQIQAINRTMHNALKTIMNKVPELWGDFVVGGKISIILDTDDIELMEAALKNSI